MPDCAMFALIAVLTNTYPNLTPAERFEQYKAHGLTFEQQIKYDATKMSCEANRKK